MGKQKAVNSGPEGSAETSTRFYILLAVVLVVVIVVIAYLLVTFGIPALRGDEQPPATQPATATAVPTFTAAPSQAPTTTPPSPAPTPANPVMADTADPAFVFDSAGARPSTEWTGFFGQVTDASGAPVQDVPVVVWYPHGQLAAPVSRTDASGYYEVRLADTPLGGVWTIQLLTEDLQPASNLFTFQTDEDSEQGIQQLQVIWRESP